MDIIFSKKLTKHFASKAALTKRYGDQARIIGRRLDDLAALSTLDEATALPGRFEALTGDRLGQYSLRLSANWRLIFEPANVPIPTLDDGGIDLTKVTAVCVTEIVDYH